MRERWIVLVCGLVCAFAPRATAQDPTLEALLDRVGRYTLAFVDQFSNVVAEERYVQRSSTSQGPRRRVVTSDFLLVRPSDAISYMPFRDVFDVDGVQVRDREQRLEKLFLKPSVSAIQQATAIADESSRYNLGSERLHRTVNNPVMALSFLQPGIQPRFRFTLLDQKGPIRFVERQRPSLIRGAFAADMLARGRAWVDFATGRVLKTELILNDVAVSAEVTTTFNFDDRFGIAVPASMTDRYVIGRLQLDGDATYGRFRRFGVTTDETIQTPDPRP